MNNPLVPIYIHNRTKNAEKLPCQRRAAGCRTGFWREFYQRVSDRGISMTDFMKLARRRGLVPDWAWYQINVQSATENWIEQREKMR